MTKPTTPQSAFPPRSERPAPPVLRGRMLAGAALIVLTTTLAYLPCLQGGFLLDDNVLLTENQLIKAADGLSRFWFSTESIDYQPVISTTFWVEWRLWGMHPTGYHVTNLVLHLVEALLIWAILRKLSLPGAFLAALLFAIHPVNVESVAWIAQRKNLMALLFFLLSILSYLQAEVKPQQRWYWLSLAAFVLAMLSKVSVAVLPLLLLGIIWWLRPVTRRDVMRTAPFFLVSIVLVLVNAWFQARFVKADVDPAGLTERVLGAGSVVWFYLYKALVPIHLSFVYPKWRIDPAQLRWWLPLAAAGATTCVLWWYRRGWSRPLLFAWGYFCVSLAPVMGFSETGFMAYSLVADHYQHIALIGVSALAAAGWSAWQQRTRASTHWVANAVAVAGCGFLAALTWQQSSLYVDRMTLYQATLKENPGSAFAHNNLGLALLDAGRVPDAQEHFEQAIRFKPDFAEAHYNLGRTLLQDNQIPHAIVEYDQAARLRPSYPEYHYDLGMALFKAGQPTEAIGQLRQAVQLKPDFAEAAYALGITLSQTGQLDEAIASYQQAVRFKPDYPEAQYNLGTALAQTHQLDAAIQHFQQALNLKPDYAEARNNLGGALFEAGRSHEAIEQYEQAVRLKPDFPEAHSNLGRALLQTHQTKAAIAHFRQALQLTPDSPDTHNDLGVALTEAGELQEAIAHFERVLQLRADYPDARNNLQEALAMKQKAAGSHE